MIHPIVDVRGACGVPVELQVVVEYDAGKDHFQLVRREVPLPGLRSFRGFTVSSANDVTRQACRAALNTTYRTVARCLRLVGFWDFWEAVQADALRRRGVSDQNDAYRDNNTLHLCARLVNETPRALATWVPCSTPDSPLLNDAGACWNNTSRATVRGKSSQVTRG